MNWALLFNSLLVAGLTAGLAGSLGFLAALGLAGVSKSWRNWLLLGAAATLISPPFLSLNCWLELLSPSAIRGDEVLHRFYSLAGVVLLLTASTWPITTLLVFASLIRLDTTQLDADPALGGAKLLRYMVWPSVRRTMGWSAVVTCVLALNNFSVPVILQVPVLPEDLWLSLTTRLNEAGAWSASGPMIAVSVLALMLFPSARLRVLSSGHALCARAFRRQLGPGWLVGSLFVFAALLFLSLGLPLKQVMINSRTWTELPNFFRASRDTVWNSFIFSFLTATLCAGTGLVTWRLRFGPILWLLFFVPGVLIGRAMISMFHGTMIYGTTAMVTLAFTMHYLALGWTGAASARQNIDETQVDSGRIDGASGWSLVRHIIWPQISIRVLAAWYVVYLLSLWDVETLVLIYPPGGETLALRIFNLLHYGHNAQVNTLILVLLALGTTPLVLWMAWRRTNAAMRFSTTNSK